MFIVSSMLHRRFNLATLLYLLALTTATYSNGSSGQVATRHRRGPVAGNNGYQSKLTIHRSKRGGHDEGHGDMDAEESTIYHEIDRRHKYSAKSGGTAESFFVMTIHETIYRVRSYQHSQHSRRFGNFVANATVAYLSGKARPYYFHYSAYSKEDLWAVHVCKATVEANILSGGQGNRIPGQKETVTIFWECGGTDVCCGLDCCYQITKSYKRLTGGGVALILIIITGAIIGICYSRHKEGKSVFCWKTPEGRYTSGGRTRRRSVSNPVANTSHHSTQLPASGSQNREFTSLSPTSSTFDNDTSGNAITSLTVTRTREDSSDEPPGYYELFPPTEAQCHSGGLDEPPSEVSSALPVHAGQTGGSMENDIVSIQRMDEDSGSCGHG